MGSMKLVILALALSALPIQSEYSIDDTTLFRVNFEKVENKFDHLMKLWLYNFCQRR